MSSYNSDREPYSWEDDYVPDWSDNMQFKNMSKPERKLGYSLKGEPLAFEEIYSEGTDGKFIHDIYIHGKKTSVDHCEYLGIAFRYKEHDIILSWKQYVTKWISSRISLAHKRTEIAPCYVKTDKIWPAWIYKLIKNEWLDSKDVLSLWMANLHTRDYTDIIPVYSARTRKFVFDYSPTYRRQYYLWSLRQVEYFVFEHSVLELHYFEERDLAAHVKYAKLKRHYMFSGERIVPNYFDGYEMNVLSHTAQYSISQYGYFTINTSSLRYIRRPTLISYSLKETRVLPLGSRNQKKQDRFWNQKIEADKKAFVNRKKAAVRQMAHRKIYNDKPRQKFNRKNRRYRQ